MQLSPGERAEVLVTVTPASGSCCGGDDRRVRGHDRLDRRDNGGRDTFDVLELRAADARPPATCPGIRGRVDEARPDEPSFTFDGSEINGSVMAMDRIDLSVPPADRELARHQQEARRTTSTSTTSSSRFVDRRQPAARRACRLEGHRPPPPSETYRADHAIQDHTDPDMPYMYHCHLLRHEDQGMMGQFTVVEPGQSATMTGGTDHEH